MEKTIKIPKELTRSAEIVSEGEGEKQVKRISISSEVPYLRYDWENDREYYEVLSHDQKDIGDERLKLGLPILFNHERNLHLGRATKFNNNGARIDVGTTGDVIWSESTYAVEKKRDIDNGSLVGTSVGYSITGKGKKIAEKDGLDVISFPWAPHEFSFCTIEADTTVGAGRQRSKTDSQGKEIEFQEITIDSPAKETNTNPTRQNLMAEPTNTPPAVEPPKISVEAERAAGRKAYRDACERIDSYVSGLSKNSEWQKIAGDIAVEHKKKDEPNFEEFRSEACDKFPGVKALTQEQANPRVGLDASAIRRFSMVKAIREMSDPKGGLTGLEKEVCEFAASQYEKKDGRIFMGACIPSDITDSRADETLDLDQRGLANLSWEIRRLNQQLGRTMNASTFSAGGFLVGTELLAGSFIDYLRNACFIGQGPFGIIELGGLVGNVAIPKQTTTASVYWLPEGGSVTNADFAGSQLYGTPHRLACLSSYTKQLLLQSTPAVEMLVRNDQARAMAVEEDRVVYSGSGASGEPIGIINTTGIDASVTFSGNWTQAKSLAFELAIENANANTVGQMVFVTSPTTKSYAKGTPQVAASTFPIFIWMPSGGEFPTIAGAMGGAVNGYGAYATKQLGNRVLFGVYNNNVIKFRWGGIDLMVEPYTGAATETIKCYTNEWTDVGVRYPQAFSCSTDAPTSP